VILLVIGKCRQFSATDCFSWIAKAQERDGVGRARRCGAAPRAGT
jgi:hypothetical protein